MKNDIMIIIKKLINLSEDIISESDNEDITDKVMEQLSLLDQLTDIVKEGE